MYSRNTRLSAGIGLAGHQKAVSEMMICWKNVKNQTNCSTEVPRCGLVEREIVNSTETAGFVLLIEISSIASTKTPGFVLEAQFSSDGSTEMAVFVLSVRMNDHKR